jgi:tetratricopeptide (TPR) repeat protein
MTPSSPDYLADLYRLEELDGWRLLARHLELTEGFSFVVVLAPDDDAVAYLRSRLPEIVGTAPGAVHRVVFDPAAPPGHLAESLLNLSLPEATWLVWVDADPAEPARIPARDEAWRAAFARLNRYRNSLQSHLRCALVLAGPFSLQAILREAAPDLWSVRSTVIRIEPVGSARVPEEFAQQFLSDHNDPDGIGLTGDPALTLAESEKIRRKPGQELLLAQLLRRAGRQAYRLLNWDLAIRCLQEASALEEAHGGDPELRFQLASDLAGVFRRLEQWDRTLHYIRRALEIARQHFGHDHPNTSAALNNLALSLQATGRLPEAEPLMREALALDEARLGPDHPDVANRLSNLAQLLQDTGRYSEAEPLMRRALAIVESRLGHEHPTTSVVLSNLALLLQETGRVSEAEPLMRRALAINEAHLGADHPKTAMRLNNLAYLLHASGRYSEAEPLMRRALAIDEARLGPDHPSVAIRLNNLARLLQDTGRLSAAEPLMRRALAVLAENSRKTAYGHPQLPPVIANYRRLLKAMQLPPEEINRRIREAEGSTRSF